MEKLSDEQEKLLDTFIDPDNAPGQYRWDEEFQQDILSMLLRDRHFLVQGLAMVKPHYFTNEAHQAICRILFNYFDKYKVLPTRLHVKQELLDVVANKPDKVKLHHESEFATVYDYHKPGVEQREYLIDKIANFAKIQETWIAFHQCVDEIKKAPEDEATWQTVHKILRDAMLVERDFNQGLYYFETVEERYARMKEKLETGETFTVGLKNVDEALSAGGMSRGEIGSVVGLSGSGKSLFLVMSAIKNIGRGKCVLYVSLEMDEDSIAQRFDAQLTAAVDRSVTIRDLMDKEDIVKLALAEYEKEYDGRQLVIKQFHAGGMDVNMLRAYHQQMLLRGFNPDLVVIDYVGEMKDYPNMPTWESKYRIVRDLRAFASECQICILTAMQPRRDARDAQDPKKYGSGVIDDDNIADAYGQIRPLDACWSINQTKEEKSAGVGRLFVIKHRHGKSRFMTFLEYDPDSLEIREISESKYRGIMKNYENTKEVHSSDGMAGYEIDKFKDQAAKQLSEDADDQPPKKDSEPNKPEDLPDDTTQED